MKKGQFFADKYGTQYISVHFLSGPVPRLIRELKLEIPVPDTVQRLRDSISVSDVAT
jgi:hypothetical protein